MSEVNLIGEADSERDFGQRQCSHQQMLFGLLVAGVDRRLSIGGCCVPLVARLMLETHKPTMALKETTDLLRTSFTPSPCDPSKCSLFEPKKIFFGLG
jgi:hypothetical protein